VLTLLFLFAEALDLTKTWWVEHQVKDLISKIVYRELTCGNLYINQHRRVQISKYFYFSIEAILLMSTFGDIGKSIMRETNKNILSRDIQAICNIAFDFLDPKKFSDVLSVIQCSVSLADTTLDLIRGLCKDVYMYVYIHIDS
jgi:hypothetical protein